MFAFFLPVTRWANLPPSPHQLELVCTVAVKILLSNVHSTHNVGDAALADLALQELRANFPSGEITLVMDNPQTYAGPEPVCASFTNVFKDPETQQFRWLAVPGLVLGSLLAVGLYRLTGRAILWPVPPAQRALLAAYFAADLVVSAPGGFLYSSKSGLGLLNTLFTLAYALWAGKPLYLFAQSIGPFTLAWQYPLIRWVLSRARLIAVRETISLQQLHAIGLKHPACQVVPDLAFLLARPSTANTQAAALAWLASAGVQPEANRPLLGVTVVNWGAQYPHFTQQADYERALATALSFFLERYGGQVVLFPQVHHAQAGSDDRVPSQRVAEQLQAWGKQVVLITTPQPYPVLKAAYGYMDLFLGTRMHSNIFALTEGVPVLAIAYQPKTLGIAQMVGIERWVIDIAQADAPTLCDQLAALWAARATVTAHLQARLPALAQQAAHTGQLIAQDFARWQASRRASPNAR